jgi:hypothetical protein
MPATVTEGDGDGDGDDGRLWILEPGSGHQMPHESLSGGAALTIRAQQPRAQFAGARLLPLPGSNGCSGGRVPAED